MGNDFKVNWTPVPAGIVEQSDGEVTLRMRVRVSFVVPDGQEMKAVNEFGTWLDALADARFKVDLDGGGSIDGDHDATVVSKTSKDAWNLLFPDAAQPPRKEVSWGSGERPTVVPVKTLPVARLASRIRDVARQRVDIAAKSILSGDAATLVADRARRAMRLDDLVDPFRFETEEGGIDEHPGADDAEGERFAVTKAPRQGLVELRVKDDVTNLERVIERDASRVAAVPEKRVVEEQSDHTWRAAQRTNLKSKVKTCIGELSSSDKATLNVPISRQVGGATATEFVQAALFHNRVAAASERDISPHSEFDLPQRASRPAPKKQEADPANPANFGFSARISVAENYPSLLEPLGIVIELQFKVKAVSAVRPDLKVKVRVVSAEFPYPMYEVRWVHAVLDVGAGTFLARSHPARAPHALPLEGGFVDLKQGDAFHVETLDVDGGALRLIQMASTEQSRRGASVIVNGMGHLVEGADRKPLISRRARALLGPGPQAGESIFKYLVPLDPDRRIPYPDELTKVASELVKQGDLSGWKAQQNQWFDTANSLRKPLTGLNAAVSRPVNETLGFKYHLVKVAVRRLPGGKTGEELFELLVGADGSAGEPDDAHKGPEFPPGRTAGVSLAWRDRAHRQTQRRALREEQQAGLAAGERELFAEDLVMGLVPEIWVPPRLAKGKGRWCSLVRRLEKPLAADVGAEECEVDAPIRLGSSRVQERTQSQGGNPAEDEYIHESLFRYDGRSLAFEEGDPFVAGKQELEDGALRDGSQRFGWRAPVDVRLPEGELPWLRFDDALRAGTSYRLRVRVVDVTGQVVGRKAEEIGPRCRIPVDQDADAGPSLEFQLHRWEPVAAPVVLLDEHACDHGRQGRGIELVTMVIRDGTGSDTRWLAPPRVPFRVACDHGKFDEFPPHVLGGFRAAALRSDGTFPVVEIDEPTEPAAARRKVPVRLEPGECPPPKEPYYPDPLAARVRFRLLPFNGNVPDVDADTATLSLYPDGDRWPRARCIRIVLHSGGKARLFADDAAGTLRVELPPSWTATLEVSSALHRSPTAVRGLGVAREFAGVPAEPPSSGADRSVADPRTLDAILDGDVPAVSPVQRLALIHAVHEPRIDPVLDAFKEKAQAARVVNSADAAFKVGIHVDDSSSGSVTLRAEWWDSEDDLAAAKDSTSNHRADVKTWPAGQVSQVGDKDLRSIEEDVVQTFPDTRHRTALYTAEVTTRFLADFPNAKPGELRRSAAKKDTLEIPSSARPHAPRVAYVMPAWSWWQRSTPGDRNPQFESHRDARRLRVYLRRPWYSSGNGEELGVLLLADHELKADDDRRVFGTRWGADPLVGVKCSSSGPTPSDLMGWRSIEQYPTACFAGGGRPRAIAGDAEPMSKIATYKVEYEPDRRLWRADLAFKSIPSPYAFIRLALVRYQACSIPGVEASPVTYTDIAQLVPNRTVVVSRETSDDDDLTLRVEMWGDSKEEADRYRELLAPSKFEFLVQAPAVVDGPEHAGWVTDLSVKPVKVERSDDPLVLEAAGLKWPGHLGRRRLVVLERQQLPYADGVHCRSRVLYADVLEL